MKFFTPEYSSTVSVGRYQIDTERQIRIEEYRGKIGLGYLRSMITAMGSDPCWSADHHGLIDFTGAELDLTANDVLRLALMMRQEQNRSYGWLVFAVNSSAMYGVIRMLGYWSRNTERFRVFKSRPKADAWLERHIHESPSGIRETPPAPQAAELHRAV
ncbi:MAG: hypothetical protein K9N23_22890 [Akkermansiaceae bacterium]|nr:hypothetical protein [Akkermansiaceae bacterium]